jgi:hypothetical protein
MTRMTRRATRAPDDACRSAIPPAAYAEPVHVRQWGAFVLRIGEPARDPSMGSYPAVQFIDPHSRAQPAILASPGQSKSMRIPGRSHHTAIFAMKPIA